MELSRLEARELLRVIDSYENGLIAEHIQEVAADDDLLQRLRAFAYPDPRRKLLAPTARPFIEEVLPVQMPTRIINGAGAAASGEFLDKALEILASRLKEQMIAGGATEEVAEAAAEKYKQEYILADRTARESQLRMQEAARKLKPVVGEQNASNPQAWFAEPDKPVAPPPERPPLGKLNRYGHPVMAYNGDNPVFQCKAGHGYEYNPTVPGCPFCFMNGADTVEKTEFDPDAIPGQDSAW